MSDASQRKLDAFPVFLKVAGRMVVIVGNGDEALAKARLIGQSSSRIRLIADAPEAGLRHWAVENGAELLETAYAPHLLEAAAMVFAATDDEAADCRIIADARALKIPSNAVDRPDICDFYTPALVNRAPVAVAIGTEGAGPVLAQMIRARVDRMLAPSLGALAVLANSYRIAAEKLLPRGSARRRFWREFFAGAPARAMEIGHISEARRAATRLLRNEGRGEGHVALVGAGPGAEDLLTLRAHRLLMQADVIVHDALVPEAVVSMGRRDAERILAGKRKGAHSMTQDEISRLLVELGREGKRVVRLKSGDPLIFGRAAEEMQALRDAGISYEVVPGVTAAFAAAADLELPLTLRGVASSLVFTTGHDLRGSTLPDWARLAVSGATVAVYMGRSVAADIAARLVEAGLSADTPVALVENASLETRRLLHGRLADLALVENRDDLAGPVLTVIGEAVAAANLANSEPLAARLPALAVA
jgi:uroporphyrin-III C-methyltransferase/precorrin-2 dehydrogenase/sirohydrochlorin ferrochelatase